MSTDKLHCVEAEARRTVDRLCEVSRKDFSNPFAMEYPASVDPNAWFFSPELLSLYGTPVYESLTEGEQKRLSFFEAVNFFSLNIHGEKSLIEGLARRLYDRENSVVSRYLHHFLDEENKHMVYFGEFCTRYAGKIYPDRKVAFAREYEEGEEDFLFFAKVLVFEEIVDLYNIRMSLDERLDSLVRRIHAMHHRDEARHLVFGRLLVRELFEQHFPGWTLATQEKVRSYLAQYILSAWTEYHNPDMYRDLGLVDSYNVYSASFEHSACRERRRVISSGIIRFFLENGILQVEPEL